MVETDGPELLELLQPLDGSSHIFGMQFGGTFLLLDRPLNKAGMLQYFEMFGDGRLAHLKRCSEFVDCRHPGSQFGQNGPAYCVRYGGAHGIQRGFSGV